MKIASLGEQTFSYQIYKIHMKGDLISCNSIQEVVNSIKNKRCDIGIVPLENRIIGKINSYNLYDLKIIRKIKLSVKMSLGGISNQKEIKCVFSKKEALMQCSDYISKNNLKAKEENTTTSGIEKALADKTIAIICSERALKHYGLKVYEKDISNIKPNYTIFGIIQKNI